MPFCTNCGREFSSTEKFCLQCGKPLPTSTIETAQDIAIASSRMPNKLLTSSPVTDQEHFESVKPDAYALGVDLEKTVASIFQKMGYVTERRKRVPTASGATAEMDIVLKRGNRLKAVECKNYDPSRAVGASDLRVFKDKLNDTGILSGVFVANTFFSEEAEKIADSVGIELWDGDELREKFFSYAIGRIRNPSLVQDPVLPLQQDFVTASSLPLRNSKVVHLFSSVLLYHPYIIVKYRLRSVRKDPTGRNHKTIDEGTYFVDALDGDVINRERGVVGTITELFKGKEQRLESKEDKLVTEDLMTIIPISQPVFRTPDYDVSVAEPSVTNEDAVRSVKDYVVEKNTREVNYEVKIRGEWETRSIRIVPHLNEVNLRGQKLVYVPKWLLQYESGDRSFERRFVASSGKTIEDEISRCEKCGILKKKPVSVCEICGVPLCEKHSHQEQGRWLCEDHVSDTMRQQIKQKGLLSRFLKR